MRDVYIIARGLLPAQKKNPATLRVMGARVIENTLADARTNLDLARSDIQALYLGNMLSDELQEQKHTAALIADESGLRGIEALDVRAATATGAAALRMAFLAIASGEADLALAAGVEKMSDGDATSALARALDAETETPTGETLLSANARVTELYLTEYGVASESLLHFGVNAHKNALTNPNALFRKELSLAEAMASRLVRAPLRLYDCSPICDGAAAVLLASKKYAQGLSRKIKFTASSAATDRFRLADRINPTTLRAAEVSAKKAFALANRNIQDIDFFEPHDAFSIMSCLSLEACGFAAPGQGWRLAENGTIERGGKLPISTMGGLKARGHPIGATAIYQTCEIFSQLVGEAGPNQIPGAGVGMLQSIGGPGTSVLTHLFESP